MYYDPRMGRFISEDSVTGKDKDPLSLNLFLYCANDPIDKFDPSGHDWLDKPINWIESKITGKPYEPASEQQKAWAAYYTGIQSSINEVSQDVSYMMYDVCRAAASADRISEITSASTSMVAAPKSNLTNKAVTYFRVQGGAPPNASRVRITIGDDGKIIIPNKTSNLNISTGSDKHANYFLQKRGAGAQIVKFDVPKWFDDFLNENAIPQKNYKINPKNQGGTAPKIVDPATPGKSFELPTPWIQWLEEYGTNGR